MYLVVAIASAQTYRVRYSVSASAVKPSCASVMKFEALNGVPKMQYENLELKRDGQVAWLTFNRPESLNALSRGLVNDFRDFLSRLASDTETRVVVLRGAGRAFCAGLDLKE